jgi:TBC1 domain family member 15
VIDEEDEGSCSYHFFLVVHLVIDDSVADAIIIEMPLARPETYAFSVPLTSIYSLIVNPPSLSSWCKSSVFHRIMAQALLALFSFAAA